MPAAVCTLLASRRNVCLMLSDLLGGSYKDRKESLLLGSEFRGGLSFSVRSSSGSMSKLCSVLWNFISACNGLSRDSETRGQNGVADAPPAFRKWPSSNAAACTLSVESGQHVHLTKLRSENCQWQLLNHINLFKRVSFSSVL